MSSSGFSSTGHAGVWANASLFSCIDSFYVAYSGSSAGLFPVINLSSSVRTKGTGTLSDPYVFHTN